MPRFDKLRRKRRKALVASTIALITSAALALTAGAASLLGGMELSGSGLQFIAVTLKCLIPGLVL